MDGLPKKLVKKIRRAFFLNGAFFGLLIVLYILIVDIELQRILLYLTLAIFITTIPPLLETWLLQIQVKNVIKRGANRLTSFAIAYFYLFSFVYLLPAMIINLIRINRYLKTPTASQFSLP